MRGGVCEDVCEGVCVWGGSIMCYVPVYDTEKSPQQAMCHAQVQRGEAYGGCVW